MPYTLSVSVANPEAVLQPVCNISDHGLVPTKLSSWTLRLTCTRKLTTEVCCREGRNKAQAAKHDLTGVFFSFSYLRDETDQDIQNLKKKSHSVAAPQ